LPVEQEAAASEGSTCTASWRLVVQHGDLRLGSVVETTLAASCGAPPRTGGPYSGESLSTGRRYSSVTVARTRSIKCSTVLSDAEQRAQSAIPNVPAYGSRSSGFGHLAHQCNPHCYFTVRDPRAVSSSLHRTVEAAEHRLLARRDCSIPFFRGSLSSLSGATQ